MSDLVELFSDLTLRGPADKKGALRDALIAAAAGAWRFDPARSEEIRRNSVSSDEILAFRHDEPGSLPAAGLTLWERPDGYTVPNIVPVEVGELTRAQYNALLQDFAEKVVRAPAAANGFDVELTSGRQGMDDWTSAEVATALRRFSGAANKSTGASHPMDQQRWFAFLLAAHRAEAKPDPDRLARWLHEVEGWDEESSHELAGDYERALALLTYADSH